MTSSDIPSTVVEAISVFFAEDEVASLCLPSGWFGRPHDNWHQLSEIATQGDDVLVRLDDRQVLRLTAEGTSLEGRVLRVMIREGRWDWTECGGDQEHTQALRVITAGAAVMVTVFLSFALGVDLYGKMFGIGLSSAVLIDATVVRMVLVPATMELVGDRNWWLPGWLDRLLPNINIEGPQATDEFGGGNQPATKPAVATGTRLDL